MKRKHLILILLSSFIFSCTNEKLVIEKILLDHNWKFTLQDHDRAEKPVYDDSHWRTLNLPHDFAIEQPFDSANPSGRDQGYTYCGIAWYRKHFDLEKGLNDKRVIVQFNGVYRNSDVWINGHHLGFWPYGYTSFYYDIAPFLNESGKDNVLAVKVNTTDQPNSRWYTGSGIYRHVWLQVSEKIHFDHWGIFAQTINANKDEAKMKISIELRNDEENDAKCLIKTLLFDENNVKLGEEVSEIVLESKKEEKLVQQITLKKPQLWSIDNPYLYRMECILEREGKLQDVYNTKIGIRTFVFDQDKGFFLNGEHVKLKGTNNHHDGGPLGAACADYTFQRQLRILKGMGCNAIRMSHNPPAQELLECADSMGFIVIDEIFDEWVSWKRKAGYSKHFLEYYEKDVTNWIRRDRNHPSIVAWSLGNEVAEQRQEKGKEILQMLIDVAVKSDTSRPFTTGCNEMPSVNKYGFGELLDIIGYNYREKMYGSDHEKYPERVIYGSETAIYPYQPGNDFPLHSYDEWVNGQMSDYVAGEFLWTGFDYIGESGIGMGGTGLEPWKYWPQWPYRSAVCGVIDLCGFEKPGYWFRKAIWTDHPVVYIAVSNNPENYSKEKVPFWGWPDVSAQWKHNKEGEDVFVQVYTNCYEVELLLNGKSLGTKKWDINQEAFLTWKVPYENGTLEAVGKDQMGESHTFKLETTGDAVKIKLIPERQTILADGQDVNYIKVQLLDKENRVVPFANNIINFSVEGAGRIKAVGNGDPTCHIPFTGKKMEAYQGLCLVIIQSGINEGEITLTASSKGLETKTTTFKSIK